MNALPRFDQVELGTPAVAADAQTTFDAILNAEGPIDWTTPEQIDVKHLYGSDVYESMDHLHTFPGMPPFLRGPYSTMYTSRP